MYNKMNRKQLENYFSLDRTSRYFLQCDGNESNALDLYTANILLSEALYSSISILEVALRNKINTELAKKYQRADWYAEWYKHTTMRYAWPEIKTSVRHLHEEGKQVVPSKVVAALTLGFWTSLFNDRYERELWSNLRFIFPNMPKSIRKRKNISSPLNEIRRQVRNRIYHNEPIIFDLHSLRKQHQKVLDVLGWMGDELLVYAKTLDRFPTVLDTIRLT